MSWWLDTGANIHVCADISIFSSCQTVWDSFVLMGNGSHVSVDGVGTVGLKFTSERSCSMSLLSTKIWSVVGPM